MHRIHPIPIARLSLDKSLMTYRRGFGQTQEVFPTIWLIEGPKEIVLVDAGCDARLAKKKGYAAEQISLPAQALRESGLSPADVDLLILTHLHFDHVGFAQIFEKATVLVQRAEYTFAMQPHPVFAGGYAEPLLSGLRKLDLLDGDTEITAGVRVLATPGHTPGGQSVAVATEKGDVVICGLCTVVENLQPPISAVQPFPVIPPGIHTNVMEAYDSLVRIQQMADLAVPLHDRLFCSRAVLP